MGYVANHDMEDEITHFRGYGWDDHRIEARLGLRHGTLGRRAARARLAHPTITQLNHADQAGHIS